MKIIFLTIRKAMLSLLSVVFEVNKIDTDYRNEDWND